MAGAALNTSGALVVLARPDQPAAARTFDLLCVAAGSLFLALLAQAAIPMWPVPITGQTLGLLLVGALLGSRRGALAVLLYLGEGACGLPVFAEWRGGLAHFAGPTGGYLLAFPVAAWLVGALMERGWDRRPWASALALTIGLLPVYASGCLWLQLYGFDAIAVGLVPFLPGAAVKIALASLLLPLLRHAVSRRRP